MKEVVVIGAGAAGLMAAAIAAKNGAKVTLLEKMNMVGKKMGITGKGRCNITNACSVEEFIAHTPGNGKFLYSAYERFDNKDLLALLKEWGLETKVERGGRVFPVSESALEVRDIFRKVLKDHKVKLHLNEKVEEILTHNGEVTAVVSDKGMYPAKAVIICTGGMSYPLTGSTGDGYKMAEALGHKITDLKPSLIPLESVEEWPKIIMGLSLRNVEVSVLAKGKVQDKKFGEMIFTHFGVSGPIILSLSHTVTKLQKKKNVGPIGLSINLKPALSIEQLEARVQRDFQAYHKKQIVNALVDLLPQRLISVVLKAAGISENKEVNQITKEERKALIHVLQHLELTVSKTRPIAEAIVTAGGISIKEFNPKTMESKLIKGLYGAGEVLDIDAFTGGYNLQVAFSTGFVAGEEAAKE